METVAIMETVDYEQLGFKCGVEIHQQLLTGKKLFCRCAAGKYSKHHNAEVLRHMRPTLSEMGVYDGTALMEFKTKKEIIYQLNTDTVCTYEMDDTPPFLVNDDALDIVIEIAALLDSTVVDEMHVARKQYLDGSIPTGFQRTAIVGMGGELPYNGKKIRIRQIALEEDSCREVSDIRHTITFRTDRLGMPLIEVVTEPDMKTPEEAAMVVREIGRLMRVTGHVRRGIGAVRQDVNVSISGGRRVEIKGVPRYQNIPLLTHNEALRQKALLEIVGVMKSRGITMQTFSAEDKDLTHDLRNTRSEHLLTALEKNWTIKGVKLCKMAELLTKKTQPGKSFAHELSGRVKVIACLDTVPNLYHTDNWPEYKGWQIDREKVKRTLGVKDEDVAVIVWGPQTDTETAVSEIKIRAMEALEGVPNETRQARFDGTTDFERILPGPDRMYPDTDHPPVKITKDRVKRILKKLPTKPWVLEKKYEEYGMPKDIIDSLPVSKYMNLVEKLSKEMRPENMKAVGVALMQTMKALSRKGLDVYSIPDTTLHKMFLDFNDKKIERKALKTTLERLAMANPAPNT